MMTYSSPDFRLLDDATSLVHGGNNILEVDSADTCTNKRDVRDCLEIEDED
jgi:hypothetical protein